MCRIDPRLGRRFCPTPAALLQAPPLFSIKLLQCAAGLSLWNKLHLSCPDDFARRMKDFFEGGKVESHGGIGVEFRPR